MRLLFEIDTNDYNKNGTVFVRPSVRGIIIKGEKIVEKRELHLPKEIKNVITCQNPRCITSIEQELDQIFLLTDPETETYRCKYCEEKYNTHKKVR